jgi:hypothetical protein
MSTFSFSQKGTILTGRLPFFLLVCLSVIALNSPSLLAQKSPDTSAHVALAPGVAWRVTGAWAAEGAPILTGDAVKPGSLLQPGNEAGAHSITVLLPDGQRIVCECSTTEDCARGFRVPPLYRAPDPFANHMLARIRAALVRDRQNPPAGSIAQHGSQFARDEAIAVLGPGNQVRVVGLVTALPNGHYNYDLRPLDPAHSPQPNLPLEKNSATIAVTLPSPGLYVLSIADELKNPRIELFLAAVTPAQASSFKRSFGNAKELMEDWDGNYTGWPLHDFQRAYLESLMQDINPSTKVLQPSATQPGKATKAAANSGPTKVPDDPGKNRSGITAEPAFSPRPGVLAGDTAVTLQCETPGAAIHYTVDSSQPTASSPVYAAPIMVKGTELTIKSFASAPSQKDSPVVTGIFRIGQ